MSNFTVVLFGLDESFSELVADSILFELGIKSYICRSLHELMRLKLDTSIVLFSDNKVKETEFKIFIHSESAPFKICISHGVRPKAIPTVLIPLNLADLFQFLIPMCGLDKKDVRKGADYFPIRLNYFKKLKFTPCDIYIRLGKDVESFRYVKRLYGDQEFGQEEIKVFEDKEMDVLYVLKEDRDKFIKYLSKELIPKAADYTKDERPILEINAGLQDVLGDLIERSNITHEMMELTNKNIKLMAQSIQKNKDLKSLLRDLFNNKAGFNYKHCYLSSVFIYHVMSKSDIANTTKIKEKHEMMCFVAFFHDILLKDEKLAKIRDKKDFYKADLSEKEKEKVKNHARDISDILAEIPGVPAEAAKILRCHHGVTNGVGFCEIYNSNLPTMAILFIVVEYFLFHLIAPRDGEGSLDVIFKNCDKEFQLPSYRNYVTILKEIFEHKL